MPFSYPVFLELRDQPCVVVGGGPETVEKTEVLLAQGARVRLYEAGRPEGLDALLTTYSGQLTLIPREYEEGDLEGAWMCIAASGDYALNSRVYAEGLTRRVLMNAVDDNDHCQFATCSTVRRGDLVIAIGTGGKAPAMAKRLRRELSARYGPEYGVVTALIGEVRAQTRGLWSNFTGWARRWEHALDDQVIALVREGRRAEARALLVARLSAPGPEAGAPTEDDVTRSSIEGSPAA